MSTDAIVMLREDHQKIRHLAREFEKARRTEASGATRQSIVDQLIELLTVHTYLENEAMYPRVREQLPELEEDILESYEEHHVADALVLELANMTPADERFDAKTTVLLENVLHHIEEEEGDWFPKVREGLGRKKLQAIGEHMQRLRQEAPRRPSQPSALKKAMDAVVG